MKLPQKCCGCCSLQTCALALGWSGLIRSVLETSSVAVTWATQRKEETGQGLVADSTLLYLLIAFIINLVVYILLLIGVHQQKHFYLIPWLVIHGMALQSLFITVIYYGSQFIYNENYRVGIPTILIGFGIIAINFYWWLCVLSLYHNLSQTAGSNNGSRHFIVGTLAAEKPPPYKEVIETV